MSWKRNAFKQEMIVTRGQTYGLPLFENKPLPTGRQGSPQPSPSKGEGVNKRLPDWVWDGSNIKSEVYRELQGKIKSNSLNYLSALITLGGSATDHEIKEFFNDSDKWPLHIVSARRNDLKKSGVVESYPGRVKPGPAGKNNTIWYVNFNNLYKLIEE